MDRVVFTLDVRAGNVVAIAAVAAVASVNYMTTASGDELKHASAPVSAKTRRVRASIQVNGGDEIEFSTD